MLHLYETPAHQNDPVTRTREGRRRLAESWREETDYGLTEPVKRPPAGRPPTGLVGNDTDNTEELMRQAGGDPKLAAMLSTRPLEEIYAQEQSRGEGNAPA
ncbi:uncharacterized protein CIMG_01079 [Coccidioides immitis RS]|uniref:Uncharacterized protein n=2 Tax=Coccidioides immitis TaxID=5501 RepID=J3KID7_COCIM|nr:uncharacterized protein CIMG_01079 [Coccidioides immitis RS]EAS35725.3 hypothetical protein CIMG_01079 [Coccidioides immitis RS]KMP01007.1 hypothetical protein CIRG_01147 [Coccidioides immitis RMSCC 2394]TPX26053.1 hypothetical protein DIZ76_011512 [Coccidioides immitis]